MEEIAFIYYTHYIKELIVSEILAEYPVLKGDIFLLAEDPILKGEIVLLAEDPVLKGEFWQTY